MPVLLWGSRDEAPLPDGTRIRDSLCGLFASGKVLHQLQVPFTYIENCRGTNPKFIRGTDTFIRAVNVANALYQSTTSGKSWSAKPISIDMSWEKDPFFINESVGWLCNDRSLSSTANDFASVFHTTDGGNTWTRLRRFEERYFYKIHFLDYNNGWVAGRNIYYTSDGG